MAIVIINFVFILTWCFYFTWVAVLIGISVPIMSIILYDCMDAKYLFQIWIIKK